MDTCCLIDMKLKDDIAIQELNDDVILVPIRKYASEFKGIVKLNETAAFLVKLLKEDRTKEELIEALSKEYDVDLDVVKDDVDRVLKKLEEINALQ